MPYLVIAVADGLLDLPPGQVRVIQTETGGGFGGKEEYPSMIAGHAALVAMKARRPVKLSTTGSKTCWRPPSAIRPSSGIAPV